MDPIKILESGLINKNQIAKLMYPTLKQPGIYLYKKLNRLQRQTFNESDAKKVKEIINDLIK